MKVKKNRSCLLIILILTIVINLSSVKGAEVDSETYGDGDILITVATGSPGSLGLLKSIAEPFCNKNRCRIKWINMGSGESLKALKSGVADIIMVHAPDAEKEAIMEGWAVNRRLIGGNEFYILGPASDPAGIKGAGSAAEAYKKIAEAKALFFTRNDNSGTHKKEMNIWKISGIKPSGSWYLASNGYMENTIIRADKEKGYFMTDSSTWYAKKAGLKNLTILFRGDPVMVNVYHIMSVPKGKRPENIYRLITGFIEFVKSYEGQKIIGGFGKAEYGAPLYINAKQAAYSLE